MTKASVENEYRELSFIISQLVSTADLERILSKVVSLSLELCGGQEASLILRNRLTGKLEIAAQKGKPADVIREARKNSKNVIARWVMKNNQPVFLKENLTGTEFEKYAKRRRIIDSFCLPLVKGSKTIGALCLNCTDASSPFKKRFKEKAQILATVSTAAINHAGLQKKLKQQYKKLQSEHQNIIRYQDQAVMAERLTSLGIMAASIAHELKSPVTTILTYAELLSGQSLPEKLKERGIKAILHEAERMSTIFKQLLDFANQRKMVEETDITDLIQNTLVFTEHHLSRFEKVSVVLDLQEGLPHVMVDKGQIQQVFVNMILNAAQAMKEGTLNVSSRAYRGEDLENLVPFDYYRNYQEREFVCAIFKDNGPGINTRDLNKIFKAFFTTKKRGEGTGLGLFICRNIIERYDGFICVDSNLGKGSTFSIFIPAVTDLS